jgi:hypothetical protein
MSIMTWLIEGSYLLCASEPLHDTLAAHNTRQVLTLLLFPVSGFFT